MGIGFKAWTDPSVERFALAPLCEQAIQPIGWYLPKFMLGLAFGKARFALSPPGTLLTPSSKFSGPADDFTERLS
ncbi:hypothetical protein CGZ80_23080 [Rhodopirellula sp. MGV]|nr:hypothetical protein CGZ80_23080 [Rhodopirellula sp. MGV]PNY34720.1 hypothetical protein C2E31_22425 [Rhodopirellula baltica]